jgi:hypothetical protein
MNSFQDILTQWNKRYDSFTKLQHAYADIALLVLVTSGIISLINYKLGQSLLFISVCALLVFIANGVVWALLRTFLGAKPVRTSNSRKK